MNKTKLAPLWWSHRPHYIAVVVVAAPDDPEPPADSDPLAGDYAPEQACYGPFNTEYAAERFAFDFLTVWGRYGYRAYIQWVREPRVPKRELWTFGQPFEPYWDWEEEERLQARQKSEEEVSA